MFEFFKQNYQWIFSGIGVAVIGFVVGLLARKHNQKRRGDRPITASRVSTKGPYSPIVVGEDNEISQKSDTGEHGTQA